MKEQEEEGKERDGKEESVRVEGGQEEVSGVRRVRSRVQYQ